MGGVKQAEESQADFPRGILINWPRSSSYKGQVHKGQVPCGRKLVLGTVITTYRKRTNRRRALFFPLRRKKLRNHANGDSPGEFGGTFARTSTHFHYRADINLGYVNTKTGDQAHANRNELGVTIAEPISNDTRFRVSSVSMFAPRCDDPENNRKIDVTPRLAPGEVVSDPFEGESLGDNCFFLDWYGTYNSASLPWVFHVLHGFQYALDAEERATVFLWDDEMQVW